MGSRISEHAAVSVRGSFVLLLGNSISLVMNVIGSILVALMLAPSEYGLLTLSFVLPAFFGLFSGWGVNPALIRYIARDRSQEKKENIGKMVWTGFRFKFLVGGGLSLILFLFAEFFASFVLKKPGMGELVRIASLLILSQSIHTAAISSLAGFEKMNYLALVNIIQSLVKGILSPLLVYLGYGVKGAVVGHVASFVLAGLIGLYLVATLTRDLNTEGESSPNIIRIMLEYGIPLFIANIIAGVAFQFRGFLLSWFVSDDVIGNFGVASWFSIFVGVISTSLGVTFFPTFSKYNVQNEPNKTRDIFQGSIRYSTVFLLPLIIMIIIISRPALYFLFGDKYPLAPLYLSLLLIPALFVGIGSLSVYRFFNSQGDTRASMMIRLIGSILTIVLSIIFVNIWSIEGLLFSYVISDLATNLLGLHILNRKYKIGLDLSHTIKTLMSSLLSGGLTFGYLSVYSTSMPLIDLLLGTGLFLLSFLILAPLVGALERKDIRNLDAMFRNLKPFYPFARIILDFEEKILEIKS